MRTTAVMLLRRISGTVCFYASRRAVGPTGSCALKDDSVYSRKHLPARCLAEACETVVARQ